MAYPTNWKRKEEESASGGKYHALDSSGNNYAGLSGMDELSQAALEAAQSSWQSANKAGDQEGMDAAHQQAESIRSKYGYSGGGRVPVPAHRQRNKAGGVLLRERAVLYQQVSEPD